MTETCRSCGAPVIWAKTEKGKSMPVDANAVDPPDTGNILLTLEDGVLTAKYVLSASGLRLSHFATCPQAPSWRKR